VTLILATLLGLVWKRLSARWKLDDYNAAVASLGESAVSAVSSVEQKLVANLRDPNRPGTLTQELGAVAKSTATDLVHVIGAQALHRLSKSGATDVQQQAIVDALIERAVITVKAMRAGPVSHVPPAPTAASAPSLVDPPASSR
jgi:hypothetical protein